MKDKPRRLFRRRAGAPMPPIPEDVEKLRGARKAIVPWRIYRMRLPDGSVQEVTGAELIRTADCYTALADAQEAGDEDAIRRAILRIAEDMG